MTNERLFKANGNIARLYSKDGRERPDTIKLSIDTPAPVRSDSGSSDRKVQHARKTQTGRLPTASRGSPTKKSTSGLPATQRGPVYSAGELAEEPAAMLASDQGPYDPPPTSRRSTPRVDGHSRVSHAHHNHSDSVWLHERLDSGSVGRTGTASSYAPVAGSRSNGPMANLPRNQSYHQDFEGRGRTSDRMSTLGVPGGYPGRSSSAEPKPRQTLDVPPMMMPSVSAPQTSGMSFPPVFDCPVFPAGAGPYMPSFPPATTPPGYPSITPPVDRPNPHIHIEQVVSTTKKNTKLLKSGKGKGKEKEKEQLEAAHISAQAVYAAAPQKSHHDKWESHSDSGSSEGWVSSLLTHISL